MMTKYRVALEASAAIGVEMELEADSEEHAERLANFNLESAEFRRKLSDLVDEIFTPDPAALEAYGAAVPLPITHASVELDENGFEVIEAFLPESLEGDSNG